MGVLQKKVCMVGVAGTGKTSLVRQFVDSTFSEKYHSTIGVKVDRKIVDFGDKTANLMLWDIEGRTEDQDISPSYLRGASGILFVVDGTRRETYEQLFELQDMATAVVGTVPSAVALNKHDLRDAWQIRSDDQETLTERGWHAFHTSAKTGEAVEEAFHWLTARMVGGQP